MILTSASQNVIVIRMISSAIGDVYLSFNKKKSIARLFLAVKETKVMFAMVLTVES